MRLDYSNEPLCVLAEALETLTNPVFVKIAVCENCHLRKLPFGQIDVVAATTGGPQVPPPREKDGPLTYFGERDPPTSVDGIALLIPSRTRRKPVFDAGVGSAIVAAQAP